MNAKISAFIICVEEIICFLLYNLHDCTFKISASTNKRNVNFLNLKTEWQGGTCSIYIIILGGTVKVLLFVLGLFQVD